MGINTINLLDPTGLGPTCGGSAPSERLSWQGPWCLQTMKHTGQEATYCLEELKALGVLLELNSSLLCLVDRFPLFLRLLAFLIKCALWHWGTAWEVKVFHRREAGTREGPTGPAGLQGGAQLASRWQRKAPPRHGRARLPVCNQVSFGHPVDKNPGAFSLLPHPLHILKSTQTTYSQNLGLGEGEAARPGPGHGRSQLVRQDPRLPRPPTSYCCWSRKENFPHRLTRLCRHRLRQLSVRRLCRPPPRGVSGGLRGLLLPSTGPASLPVQQ